MKFIKINLLGLFLCLIIFSCGHSLPEDYGVYGYTGNKCVSFETQNLQFKGTLFQSITGLKGPSGAVLEKVDYLIVFLERITPDLIQLSKLEFIRQDYVTNIMGHSGVELNMWVAAEPISFKIESISSDPDMYKLIFNNSLTDGFYAIHFGNLGKGSSLELAASENIVYDFVVGQLENYPSFEELKKRNEEQVKNVAIKLIDKMNNLYNENKFVEISSIYKPNGYTLTGNDLDDYIKGSKIWFFEAGRIENYTIQEINVSETFGVILINTEYEKIGRRIEKMLVNKIGENYFITSIH